MCAYYSPIYQDVTARLLTKNGSVCLFLSIGKADAASVHITLNPMQAKLLGKYLQIVAGQVLVGEMGADRHFFGNLTVTFDKARDEAENSSSLPLPVHAA